jgi:low temperature requirement protein LtrA
VLAATLWWVYFIAAAPISEAVLRASGGNPAMAYGLYADGHLSPAFSLLAMAAGVSLAITGHASQAAAWFTTREFGQPRCSAPPLSPGYDSPGSRARRR